MIFSTNNLFCFGVGEHLSLDYYKYFNGRVTEIIEERYIPDDSYHVMYKQNYRYLQNGVILIEGEQISGIKYKYVCYNEYYNDNIKSEARQNEMIELVYQSIGSSRSFDDIPINITYKENTIEIKTSYDLIFSITEMKQVLTFDPLTNRLAAIQIDYKESNKEYHEIRKYNYKYDSHGRLSGIYRTSDQGNSNTLYYYDGVLRFSPLEWFLKPDDLDWEEMVIYENNMLKYHIRTNVDGGDGKRFRKYYVLFNFDDNRNEISQAAYHQDNRIVMYERELVELDDRKNWTHIRVFKEGQLAAEYYRRISYEN